MLGPPEAAMPDMKLPAGRNEITRPAQLTAWQRAARPARASAGRHRPAVSQGDTLDTPLR